jgi:hypothetical protein
LEHAEVFVDALGMESVWCVMFVCLKMKIVYLSVSIL